MTICAATAYAFNENIKKVFECGMHEYLSKPLDVDKVRGMVTKYVKEV